MILGASRDAEAGRCVAAVLPVPFSPDVPPAPGDEATPQGWPSSGHPGCART